MQAPPTKIDELTNGLGTEQHRSTGQTGRRDQGPMLRTDQKPSEVRREQTHETDRTDQSHRGGGQRTCTKKEHGAQADDRKSA